MALLTFQKPDKVKVIEAGEFRGKFEFCPLEPGFGLTIGNAFRRILLSSLEGFAISSVYIEGVEHEFSSIPGVMEDVTEIILNLKKVRFKQLVPDVTYEKVYINFSGKEEFCAGDITQFMSNFKILNPKLLICRLNPDVKLKIELAVINGRGYVQAEEHKLYDERIGLISVSSIFTPIRNVKYSIEDMRVDQKTDYDRLILEIETDGSISPKSALTAAAKILIHHFMLCSDDKIVVEELENFDGEELDEEILRMRQLLKTKLGDMDLSVRALNCLKTAELETLGDLVKFNKSELLKFRNFGKKSLTELEALLITKKLNFGMDISKYKLDSIDDNE
jgi:DNA-directed RNA polymerase subunit alpha